MGFTFAPTLIACLAWAVKSYNMQQSNAVTASPVRSSESGPSFSSLQETHVSPCFEAAFFGFAIPRPPFSAVAACVFSI